MPFPRRVVLSLIALSSCVHTIEGTLAELTPPPSMVEISIVLQSVKVYHDSQLSSTTIRNTIVNAGFDVVSDSTSDVSVTLGSSILTSRNSKHLQQCKLCQEEHLEPEKSHQSSLLPGAPPAGGPPDQGTQGPFKVTFSVGGMTCTACSNSITDAVKDLPGVSEVVVSLLDNSASAIVEKEGIAQSIVEAIDDCGFEATTMSIKTVTSTATNDTTRTVLLHIKGMHCQ